VPGRRRTDVNLGLTLDADFDQGRKSIARDLDKIERDAKDAADEIEDAFKKLSPELDTSDIRKALDLAGQLDGMVAEFTVDSDLTDILEAEKIARDLRRFQGRVELSVEGREELKDALGLADKLEQIRQVKVQVQGREDLEKAARLADDLERRRTVPIDAQASDLVRLDDEIERALTSGGEAGAAGMAGALSDIDFGDIGSSAADQMSGALAAAGPWAAAAGAVGAVFGDEFLEGFNNALPDGRGDAIRALRNNLSESDLVEVGEAGGEAYSSGLADGLTGAKDAAALIKGELGGIDDDLDLTEVTRQAMALEQVFGTDLSESVAAVDKLLSQGLVKNSEEGFNLLFELGQQTGTQFDEMLELTSEFSTALRALGIEGPRGLKLIGEMVEQGIFPQVDQAGEVFEELNETIISGGAADALEKLSFNAKDMQETIAGGGPKAAAAVADIAERILSLDSEAERAAATTEIFGGNMGLLGDEARTAALELFATADGTSEVGNAASDAADKIEGSASGLDRLKKVAVELGNELGGTVADGLDTLNALAELDFSTAAGSATSFGEALSLKVLGPASELIDPLDRLLNKVGLDLPGAFDVFGGKADDLPPKLAAVVEKGTRASGTLDELGTEASDAADGIDEAKVAAEQLESELQGLFSFSFDQLMRQIADETRNLGEQLEGGAAKAVGMNGAIDISTEAGARLQAQMETLNGAMVDAATAYANQEITADQLAQTQTYLSGEFDRVTSAAGVTTDKTEGLRQKYLDVDAINSITTDFIANTEGASAKVTDLKRALDALPRNVVISASINGPVGVSTGSGGTRLTADTSRFGRAKGGPVEAGQVYTVGEEGMELFVSDEAGQIIDANDTRRILAGSAAAQSFISSAAAPRGGGAVRGVLEIGSDGSDHGQYLMDQLRKAVRNRGGNLDIVFRPPRR